MIELVQPVVVGAAMGLPETCHWPMRDLWSYEPLPRWWIGQDVREQNVCVETIERLLLAALDRDDERVFMTCERYGEDSVWLHALDLATFGRIESRRLMRSATRKNLPYIRLFLASLLYPQHAGLIVLTAPTRAIQVWGDYFMMWSEDTGWSNKATELVRSRHRLMEG